MSYICSDEKYQDAYSDYDSIIEVASLPDVHIQTQVQQSQLLPFQFLGTKGSMNLSLRIHQGSPLGN